MYDLVAGNRTGFRAETVFDRPSVGDGLQWKVQQGAGFNWSDY